MGKKQPDADPPVRVETTMEGDGKTFPSHGDALTVHYTGRLAKSDEVFDSSRERAPFSFTLGAGTVIRGWELGVASMSLGQRATLSISAEAAYGRKGCDQRGNASGTGFIPPNAALIFDVELLDINDQRGVASEGRRAARSTLRGVPSFLGSCRLPITPPSDTTRLLAYRAKLDVWLREKLERFDAEPSVGAKQAAKHGDRAGYEAHLRSQVEAKCAAERAKLGLPRSDASAVRKGEAEAGGGGAEGGGTEAPPSLSFDARIASVKVEPKDDEDSDANFPRNLHNAAELFAAAGMLSQAAQLHDCSTRLLSLLSAGPTGRQSQRIGRACICWSCGHVGLPSNASSVVESVATLPGVCAACGENAQTNFVRVVSEDGAVVPWIEDAESERAPRPEGQGE